MHNDSVVLLAAYVWYIWLSTLKTEIFRWAAAELHGINFHVMRSLVTNWMGYRNERMISSTTLPVLWHGLPFCRAIAFHVNKRRYVCVCMWERKRQLSLSHWLQSAGATLITTPQEIVLIVECLLLSVEPKVWCTFPQWWGGGWGFALCQHPATSFLRSVPYITL
jgi:hypothetical protein